jgi:hypothetical protein
MLRKNGVDGRGISVRFSPGAKIYLFSIAAHPLSLGNISLRVKW